MKPGKDFIGIGCGAFILNEKRQVLMMKRNENCQNSAGHWTIPGGTVEFNKRVEDAVVREIKEEIGLDIEVIKLISVTNDIIKQEGQHWFASQFLCKIIGGELQNMEPHKCDSLEWFDLDSVPEKLTLTTQKALQTYRGN
jgi:8-oxo-dGTP diphosphatase